MSISPLEELKAKEAKITADLLDRHVTTVDLPRAFYPEQVGLREVMVDGLGRLWDVSSRPIKMVFDPRPPYRGAL